jgi:hypothetical protein
MDHYRSYLKRQYVEELSSRGELRHEHKEIMRELDRLKFHKEKRFLERENEMNKIGNERKVSPEYERKREEEESRYKKELEKLKEIKTSEKDIKMTDEKELEEKNRLHQKHLENMEMLKIIYLSHEFDYPRQEQLLQLKIIGPFERQRDLKKL